MPDPEEKTPGTRLFDIQVKLMHVFVFLSVVIVHEAGVVWWGSAVSSQIVEIKTQIAEIKKTMIDGDDVRKILDREAPWHHDREQIYAAIKTNEKEGERLDSRIRELEKLTTRISVQLETIIERLPPK